MMATHSGPPLKTSGAASPSPTLQTSDVWHALAPDRVLESLGTTVEGLRGPEAAQRLAQLGPNVLERAANDGLLVLVWRQINNPLVWVLIGSTVLAVALGKVADGLVVLAVVVLNSIIGFVQEHRAGRAIAALSAMVPENATVRRDGRSSTVPLAKLVPGDVVLLAAGDRVPADMRVLAAKNLRADEAALTGESAPVEKTVAAVATDATIGDRTCMVFGGTLVTYGAGTAVVVATGNRTELGRISAMLRETSDLQTPLTRALATIGTYITLAITATALTLLAVGSGRLSAYGVPFTTALKETIVFAIALAVGAIPEGVPAIVTIALAAGVRRMAARRAIIRKLAAAETLGSTTVICSDKTGTLTRNEMTVVAAWTPGGRYEAAGIGYNPVGHFDRDGRILAEIPADLRQLLLDAALCNDASLHHEGSGWSITGDPTEAALVVAAEKAGVRVDEARGSHARRDGIPFESENQFMATLHAKPDGNRIVIMKGAPEIVLPRCTTKAGLEVDTASVQVEVERMAARGMRVLAVCEREWERADDELMLTDTGDGFRFMGLIGMIDPPRPEAIEAVRACQRAGIRVKMITGDHHTTARAIAAQLGLLDDGPAVTGRELSAMTEEQLQTAARETHVFARVAPEHKLRLVKALQAARHVVAMTGDGVNDAPALKQANVGVAMGIAGTSAAKEAADIVLTDDNFATIVAAVEEGRRVYDNLIKSLAFVLPTNLGLAVILICAVLFFPLDPVTGQLLLPMQPTQLLWINLVSTVTLALPLAFEAKECDIMCRPPRRRDEPILNRFVLRRTITVALLMAAGAMGLFYWEFSRELQAGRPEPVALAEAQTMAVTSVIVFQISYMLNCRSLRESVLAVGVFANRTVLGGIAAILVLQAVFIYAPFLQGVFATHALPLADLGTAVLVGTVILPVVAVEKRWESRATR